MKYVQKTASKLVTLSIIYFVIVNFNNAHTQTWNLDKCIDTALQNNLTLQSARINAATASVTLKNAKENNLPSLNAGATHGYNWGQTIDLFTNQFATNRVMYENFYLTSSVALFSGLQNYYSIKAYNAALQGSIVQQEIVQRNVKTDVAAAYLQVLLNKEIVSLSGDNLKKTQQQLDRITALYNENQATEAEVSEINAQLFTDEYTLLKVKNDLHYSSLLLQQLLNIPISDEFDISDTFSDSLAITPASDTAMLEMPDIIKIELDIQKQMYMIKSTKGNYYPSLTLSGALGSGYSGNDKQLNASGEYVPRPFKEQVNNNLYQSLYLTLSIPVFNKNYSRNQVKIQELQLQSLYVDKQSEYNQLKQKIEQLSVDILNTGSQLEALEKVYASAELNYTNFLLQYEAGSKTYTQLTESKNKLYQAQSELIQAKFQLYFKQLVLGFYYN